MRLLLVALSLAHAELLSAGVGLIGHRAVTSREVQIQHLLDVAMTDPVDPARLRIHDVDSRAFAKLAQETLLEHVVALEAQSFNLMQISNDELAGAKRRAAAALGKHAAWIGLRVEPRELDDGIRRKLQARRFVKFRTESSALPVTDAELRRAFDADRASYGTQTFERARDKVRAAVARASADKRLREWYDGLLAKYAVKNLIAEM